MSQKPMKNRKTSQDAVQSPTSDTRHVPPDTPRADHYGHFDSRHRTFVLTADPPAKWWNVHYNQPADDEIYADVSHLGDGPVRMRDKDGVELNITGYDKRCVYIRDEASGVLFNPWGIPAPQAVTNHSCTYHAAYTRIDGECAGLSVSQRVFVPRNQPVELTTLTLRNLTSEPKTVSVFGYVMFDLTGRDAAGKGFGKDNYTDICLELGGVIAVNRNRLCPHDRCKAYCVALGDIHAADGYRDHVQRQDFSIATPKMMWGYNCQNRPGFGPDCAATIQVKRVIPPGATARVDFVLGQCRDAEDVKRVRAELSPEKIDALCEERIAFENDRSAVFDVDTGHPNLDAIFNHFVKKQISSYVINKSGFRDNLQNDVGLALFDYPEARANLLRALASQYPNGECPHGFRPLIRERYSDKPAWIFLTVPELIKESGDFGLLEEVVPYLDSDQKGTVLDHMLRAMRYLAADTGKYGLCRQHVADWNDRLEATPETGERESVMVTQQLCFGMLQIDELARRIGNTAVAQEAAGIYDHFKKRLNEVAWDGEWYVRTFCEDGYRIGSSAAREGRIFMNTQSWAILSRTADGDRARLCMESVDRHLETNVGYCICLPAFTEYDPRVGQMSNTMPGFVENGGCYNHAAGFKGVADCLLGRADKAWETLIKVAPDNPQNPVGRSGAAPFCFNSFYSQVPQIYGNGGIPWRTGTANWFTLLLVEYILGARRDYDGLRLRPCLPGHLRTARLKRTFRGAIYDIHYRRESSDAGQPPRITVDGRPLEGDLLPLLPPSTVARVEVVL